MTKKPNTSEQKEISEDVGKMVGEWEKTGEIKTSRAEYHPETKKKAIKEALAIEYGKHHAGRAGARQK